MRRLLCSVVLVASAVPLALGGSGAATSGVNGVVIPATPHERIPAAGGTFKSINWSGYAVKSSSHSISRATSKFTVPAVKSSPSGFASTWVGIGGFATNDLVQAGISEQSASPHYFAWWETLPAPATRIRNKPVSPGDHVTVSVARVSAGRWKMSLSDTTKSWSWSKTVSYDSSRASAEWILEAPTIGGRQSTLPGLSTAKFGPTSTYVTNGVTHRAAQGSTVKIDMVNEYSGEREATPSALGSNGQSFNDCAYKTSCPAP